MDSIDARSPAELDRNLHAKDIQVPLRTEERQTKDVEAWVACRFLSTMSRTDLLRFPLRVEHADRPDFVLSGSDMPIGIELTEAISTDQARVCAEIERDEKCEFRSVPHYRISDQARSYDEIRALAQPKSQALPRMGDSVECDWVDAMSEIVARKATKFFKPGFASHPVNWLLVYDNWQPVALLDEEAATTQLHRESSFDGWSYPFSMIFIQRPRTIWEFAPGTRPVEHRIPDCWVDG